MYFRVKYADGTKDTLNLIDSTKIGKTYRRTDTNQVFKVINAVNFKLTMDDIDNLRVMLEGFTEGIYFNIYKRVMKCLERGIPAIRFDSYEKEHLQLLLDTEGLPEFKTTLIKIIGDTQ